MSMLPLTFILPLIGFLLLATLRDRLSENAAAAIGVGSMGLAALCALLAGGQFLMNEPQGAAVYYPLWTWMQVGSFAPKFGLMLDGLGVTMLGVITGVGFLIH